MTMPPTTSYSFGDLVLVPFPFTDQSATKRRPAVVVSSHAYHAERADLIIMAELATSSTVSKPLLFSCVRPPPGCEVAPHKLLMYPHRGA